MKNDFYTNDELKMIGFKSIGHNVLISKKCSIYSPDKISIGDNVRIDDFCILSGNIEINSFIHISAGVYLFAGEGLIQIDNYSNISSRCALYAASDDFGGDFLIGPMVDDYKRNVVTGRIILEKYSMICTGSTVMPDVIIHEGGVVGAMSFVKKDVESWSIYCGVPCKKIKQRSKKLLEFTADEN